MAWWKLTNELNLQRVPTHLRLNLWLGWKHLPLVSKSRPQGLQRVNRSSYFNLNWLLLGNLMKIVISENLESQSLLLVKSKFSSNKNLKKNNLQLSKNSPLAKLFSNQSTTKSLWRMMMTIESQSSQSSIKLLVVKWEMIFSDLSIDISIPSKSQRKICLYLSLIGDWFDWGWPWKVKDFPSIEKMQSACWRWWRNNWKCFELHQQWKFPWRIQVQNACWNPSSWNRKRSK